MSDYLDCNVIPVRLDGIISIIVPVYKVEKYLAHCIESILRQTYPHFELILVDDGSPDNCGLICDAYSRKDPRIKVIHKKNGGVSDARNVGLDIAQGQFLTFIDSDDWVHETYLEKLLFLMNHYNADISVCGFHQTKRETCRTFKRKESISTFTGFEALEHWYTKFSSFIDVAWGKLYKSTFFSEVRFPVGRIHEDTFTTYKVIYKAKRIVFTSECLLYYRQRKDSIIGMGFVLKNELDYIDALRERAIYFEKIGLAHINSIVYKYIFFSYRRILHYINKKVYTSNIHIIIELNKYLDNCFSKCKFDKKIGIFYNLFSKFPKVVNYIYFIYYYIKIIIKKAIHNL